MDGVFYQATTSFTDEGNLQTLLFSCLSFIKSSGEVGLDSSHTAESEPEPSILTPAQGLAKRDHLHVMW